MRQIYLIARREYLAFIMAWGFWVSLLIVPFFISVSFLAPVMAQRATPTRYYAVIAQDPALEAAFQAGLASGGQRAYVGAVREIARLRGVDAATERRAIEAYEAASDSQAGLVAAAEVLDLPGASAFQLPSFGYERVDPPTTDPDALRPYLLGQAAVATPEGPRGLHAAIFLRRGANGVVDIDYWSANLTDSRLSNVAEDAMRELMRREAFAAAGVPIEAVARANALEPHITELNPERESGSAEVTLADRLPGLVGMGMGFALWIVIFSVVNVLLTSVIEEKGGKILESLLSTARYHEILTGKLIGVAGVSGTLIAVWGGFAVFGLVAMGRAGAPLPAEVLDAILNPGLLIPFLGYFVLGYLMYGAIFLAVGSLCESIQEAQTLMTPMIFVLMVPMLVVPVALRAPDAPIVQILSWIPLYTPFLMMLRLPQEPPLLEIVGTSLLLVAATALILWAAGGVFRAGVIGSAGVGNLKALFSRIGGKKPAAAEKV